ncbi:MAG: outer membrane lipoprotein-sorting protein [Gammaproteobacteria bacterium]|nr:outer membrane lipoprotein-sorting protein [Gammaproteobacteria bacterium]MDH4313991.1 outer membrane lipoprotein-sorting protein [Gammaproteobacteria bacterium]MDH5212725.1 outer membrane lipoprotein-sorting protein [Gammaproteobacteria bacterium]
MAKQSAILSVVISLLAHPLAASAQQPDAAEIVRGAIDHWRGTSSYSEMTMIIHRPDWQRTMSMRGWTEGDKRTLVRVTEPQKDRGNGTLMIDNTMWTYSPKVNRVIKIPSSMMSQSWMGSDFSNKDISRSDDIVDQYEHNLIGTTEAGGHVTYEIQSVPHEDAAVVWGKEVLTVRDDYVLIGHEFYDQDGMLVKKLTSLEIGEMGGRSVAIRQRMGKVDEPDEWTEVRIDAIEYGVELNDNVFTQSNLRNPRN